MANKRFGAGEDDDIFDKGTPWDFVLSMGQLVDKVVSSHNKLANDHDRLVKRVAVLEARVQELKRNMK